MSGTLLVMASLLLVAACADGSRDPGKAAPSKGPEEFADRVARLADEMPELFIAVAAGDEPQVRELLAAGADPRELAGGWLSVLELAAADRPCQPGIIRALAERGANPNLADGPSGSTPLLTAASLGNQGCFHELVRQGANASHVDNNGVGIVAEAYLSGDAGFFEAIAQDESTGPKDPRDLAMALMLAVRKQDRQACGLLLEAGADPDLTVPRYGSASALLMPTGIASLAECESGEG